MKSIQVLGGSLCLAVFASAADPFDPSLYTSDDVIERDVAVVGGGASGTYAAINLRDSNKSVVLIERNSRLGGHSHIYTDPNTGQVVNYGVQFYHDDDVTRQWFARLNVEVDHVTFSTATPVYADFSSGEVLANYTNPGYGQDYIDELHKYPYLENGIDLPDPVPEDLLLTWPEYMKKFNIEDQANAIFSTPASPGHLLEALALYVFNDINSVFLAEGQGANLAPVSGNNAELFENALAELGSDALLESTVIDGSRSSDTSCDVRLVVKTPTGNKLIIAKQLVLGIPPVLDNMNSFGLDSHEQDILGQLHSHSYYTGVVNNTGLSEDHTYNNRGVDTEYNVAAIPSVSQIFPTAVTDYFYYWYAGEGDMTQSEVESSTKDAIKELQEATNVTTAPEPNFVAFTSHTPFHLTVSADSIRDGFYDDIEALQGYRNTWYIGALRVVGSSPLWNATSLLLPDIIAALG